MVDISEKRETERIAVAECRVFLGKEAFDLIAENRNKKGDALGVAQLAAIMAAKQTSNLIPLCHQVALSNVKVTCTLDESHLEVEIIAMAKTTSKTGVEMEALVAASVAALTVYDMCKSVTHKIVIRDIRLKSKSGGKRDYQASCT